MSEKRFRIKEINGKCGRSGKASNALYCHVACVLCLALSDSEVGRLLRNELGCIHGCRFFENRETWGQFHTFQPVKHMFCCCSLFAFCSSPPIYMNFHKSVPLHTDVMDIYCSIHLGEANRISQQLPLTCSYGNTIVLYFPVEKSLVIVMRWHVGNIFSINQVTGNKTFFLRFFSIMF